VKSARSCLPGKLPEFKFHLTVNPLAASRHLCWERKDIMNTGFRRFILRLAVGLLAFLLGITAAWALGGFHPFRKSSDARYYYRFHLDDSSRDTTPAFDHPRYRKHDKCRMRGELGNVPPAPYADAPLPPPPPPSVR
jgi:hypothetical protein